MKEQISQLLPRTKEFFDLLELFAGHVAMSGEALSETAIRFPKDRNGQADRIRGENTRRRWCRDRRRAHRSPRAVDIGRARHRGVGVDPVGRGTTDALAYVFARRFIVPSIAPIAASMASGRG
jgi:hypothetical protein